MAVPLTGGGSRKAFIARPLKITFFAPSLCGGQRFVAAAKSFIYFFITGLLVAGQEWQDPWIKQHGSAVYQRLYKNNNKKKKNTKYKSIDENKDETFIEVVSKMKKYIK